MCGTCAQGSCGGYMYIKSENYVSVVMLFHNDAGRVKEVVERYNRFFKEHFKYYEFIFVDNASNDDTVKLLKELNVKNTLIELPSEYKPAAAIEAGIDCAVGDYIYEIMDVAVDFDNSVFGDMYDACQKGNDFVYAVPKKSKLASRIFYYILNKNLHRRTHTKLTSSVCILSSRRGQNRVTSIGNRNVNRNIAYALVGLSCAYVDVDCSYRNRRGFFENFSLMIDSFIYYTSFITHALVCATMIFVAASLALGLYSIISYFCDEIVEGWTSTILYVSCGFAALFLVLSLIIKYLEHILKNTTNGDSYVYKNLTKNQSGEGNRSEK